MKILCFGSLNIDYTYQVPHFVQKGETLSSSSLQIFSGGKGLNQAIALAKAGAITYHAGAIGKDGSFLLAAMEDAGVHTDFVSVLDHIQTGHAIIQNDVDGENCILLYGGANQAITPEMVDHVLSGFESGDYLLLQNEINETAYIVEQAAKKGMKIILNPSPMNEKILALPLDKVDYFILNEVEAGQILHDNILGMDTQGMADALRRHFPKASIILTLGSQGSIYIDASQIVEQSAYTVKAVDTTAAGDTFTGFFLAGLIKGERIFDVMDQAAKASAIAVTRPGAAPSIPTLQEVEAYSFV